MNAAHAKQIGEHIGRDFLKVKSASASEAFLLSDANPQTDLIQLFLSKKKSWKPIVVFVQIMTF